MKSYKISILDSHPMIAKEWHPIKNGIDVSQVTRASNMAAWWFCNCGYEWQDIVLARSRGRGCPKCTKWRTISKISIKESHPKLLNEWHEKNTINPKEVTKGSHTIVWWKCESGHEWEAKVCMRTKGRGCPTCAVIKSRGTRSFQAIPKNLLAEWDIDKNGLLNPRLYSQGSSVVVWWKCKYGHSWKSPIKRRKNSGCPYCITENRNKPLPQNLIKEWHPKNIISYTEVTSGSNEIVWWICSKGHEWQVGIDARTCGKTGCPKCANQGMRLR